MSYVLLYCILMQFSYVSSDSKHSRTHLVTVNHMLRWGFGSSPAEHGNRIRTTKVIMFLIHGERCFDFQVAVWIRPSHWHVCFASTTECTKLCQLDRGPATKGVSPLVQQECHAVRAGCAVTVHITYSTIGEFKYFTICNNVRNVLLHRVWRYRHCNLAPCLRSSRTDGKEFLFLSTNRHETELSTFWRTESELSTCNISVPAYSTT